MALDDANLSQFLVPITDRREYSCIIFRSVTGRQISNYFCRTTDGDEAGLYFFWIGNRLMKLDLFELVFSILLISMFYYSGLPNPDVFHSEMWIFALLAGEIIIFSNMKVPTYLPSQNKFIRYGRRRQSLIWQMEEYLHQHSIKNIGRIAILIMMKILIFMIKLFNHTVCVFIAFVGFL